MLKLEKGDGHQNLIPNYLKPEDAAWVVKLRSEAKYEEADLFLKNKYIGFMVKEVRKLNRELSALLLDIEVSIENGNEDLERKEAVLSGLSSSIRRIMDEISEIQNKNSKK